MEKLTLNRQVERVHYTRDHQFFRENRIILIIVKLVLVILGRNHLIMIEIEIFDDNHSHVVVFEMFENTFIHS